MCPTPAERPSFGARCWAIDATITQTSLCRLRTGRHECSWTSMIGHSAFNGVPLFEKPVGESVDAFMRLCPRVQRR